MSDSNKEGKVDKNTLFVRGIPTNASKEQLSDFFSQFAPVKHAIIVTDKAEDSKGFGFVSFTSEDDSVLALAGAKAKKFNKVLLKVDIAKRRERKEKKASGEIAREKPKYDKESIEKRRPRLIVRNLPWSARSSQDLKEVFEKFGNVVDVIIPRKAGGRMSGFAFVTMRKQSGAEAAVAGSKDLKIDGREVQVELALEKEKFLEKKKVETKEESDDEDDDDDDDEDEVDEDGEIEDDEDEDEEDEDHKPNRQTPYCIFIRNLPYDASEETLQEHFEKFGPIRYALPVVDHNTGQAKGTGFVAFKNSQDYEDCLLNAPKPTSNSVLLPDEVSPLYVYQGRVLSIAPAVDRDSAGRLMERNEKKRQEALGKGEKDKRNIYLLHEGRISENSVLASLLTPADLKAREESYKLRVQQLNKNPTLHLSLTRLAIRNLPRAMTEKSLKALGRKAIVEFATELRQGKRNPFSKEELVRSSKHRFEMEGGNFQELLDEATTGHASVTLQKKNKKKGVVLQSKIITEVKGTGEQGRSRGYGFLEYRDHKHALMGLRWLNAHLVTPEEIFEGLNEDEKKSINMEGFSKRRLIVEFAIENAQVVRRRKEKAINFRKESLKRKADEMKKTEDELKAEAKKAEEDKKAEDVRQIIADKRRRKKRQKH
ncbi:Processing and maturation of 27S pre-rRNA protein [Komagataella phaffii CBS 7435]|uniref:Nucleolar protein n=2 Tax=Komagataella phaffii TaxID=460519 RepID=C4R3V5_KOMPG|nr:Nucleolar protein [Komagataella phaffii GS115]AOA64287.1 GQ67_03253T0 [Komagataella phaffii]CAH2450019.1 Processing and maturation of 27S pre-rRNA protein [Komagataella phaffii CBS 7435]AOA68201.1 GQ68_03222T0 [Komagataella phaffii GS115]CAY70207.1 Nucleolar protein [Komagataella phaffii GS115]CCA39963.1 Processing and maturation of 27S pre-rRNA protein [Komagataella phaffii CBS 7435]